MAKIDLEKLICSLAERNIFLRDALKEQGLEYKDGEIVENQKPKFKVGDWVVYNCDICQIVKREEGCNKLVTNFGIEKELVNERNLSTARLWTIQDAKDGDILACGDKVTDCPFIFHNLTEKLNPRSYCGVNTLCDFQENDENGCSWCKLDEVRPATKEQRDFLFQKMKEAGYKWDAEKKELKPIDNRFDYEHANIQQKDFAPKAVTAHRQVYNRAILKILSNYVEKYPDIRFGQMLCNLGIGPVFNEESRETYCNLNETINKQKS